MKSNLLELLPLPRYHRLLRQPLDLPAGSQLALACPADFQPPARSSLAQALAEHDVLLVAEEQATSTDPSLRLAIEELESANDEAYELLIVPDGISIKANHRLGWTQGLRTLTQWVAARLDAQGCLAGLEVEDTPSFPERGVMLDISRDRVPTLATLFELVEELASFKYNRLQLYTEHTFAYRNYADVWHDCSPLEANELKQLDAHCRAHGIELVPNQQSFGHLHHWLKHPRLQHLAECPEGIEHPFSKDREPFGLCPEDPRSLEFLDELYTELLPNFESDSLNVGCDETIDLGLGRSAAACEERGVGQVYLDFLEGIHGLLARRGKRMQFWADIVMNHPELVPELPERLPGATAMLWGYEADHPFEAEAQRVSASGLDFYVCPGTSAWQSLAGRLENMTGNLRSAARHGVAHGARGLLVTDWGDRGHLQPLCSCLPAWAMAADLAWNHAAPSARHSPAGLTQLLAQHFLLDPTAASAQAMVQLAQVSELLQAPWPNASPVSLLLTKAQEGFPPEELAALTVDGLRAGADQIQAALKTLKLHQMERPNAAQVLKELTWTGELMLFAIELGRARLDAKPGNHLGDLPQEARRSLAKRLAPLIEEHARLWRSQHRPGGLMRSSLWLERIRTDLNAES